MLATGHQVVSSMTTREIVMSMITLTRPGLASGELAKAQTTRVLANSFIPIFQAPLPLGATRTRKPTAQTSPLPRHSQIYFLRHGLHN